MQLPDTLSRASLPYQKAMSDHIEQISMSDFIAVRDEKYRGIQQLTQQQLGPLLDVVPSGWPDSRQEGSVIVCP